MEYPQRYFSRLFAGMRQLEFSRRFAIYFGIILFLIAALSVAVIWTHNSIRVRPYFIYMTGGGEMSVYSEGTRARVIESPWYYNAQEGIAIKYATNYMTISTDDALNQDTWCRSDNCNINWDRCYLYCVSSDGDFNYFERNILPQWKSRFANGKSQTLANVVTQPQGAITADGGFWKITGDLMTDNKIENKIVGFISIGRMQSISSRTSGFYVSEFEWYNYK